MFAMEKILSVLLFRRGLGNNTSSFYGLLTNIVAILALIVMLIIMMGAILFGILFIIYNYLIANGSSPLFSTIIISGIIFIIVAVLLNRLFLYQQKIKDNLHDVLSVQAPLANKATGFCQAFISGLFKNSN